MMRNRIRIVAVAILLFVGAGVSADSPGSLKVQNLSELSSAAIEKSLPILLIMSASDCKYCELLKDEIIAPMLKSGLYQEKVIIREFMIDGDVTVTDFDQTKTDPRKVSSRYDVVVTPTILFLDPYGFQIEDRIVGAGNVEFASHYIDKSVDSAFQSVRKSTYLSSQQN